MPTVTAEVPGGRRAVAARLREEGWSNKQIARHLGVHPSTVGRWFTPPAPTAIADTSTDAETTQEYTP